jgi:hypothetical protein
MLCKLLERFIARRKSRDKSVFLRFGFSACMGGLSIALRLSCSRRCGAGVIAGRIVQGTVTGVGPAQFVEFVAR